MLVAGWPLMCCEATPSHHDAVIIVVVVTTASSTAARIRQRSTVECPVYDGVVRFNSAHQYRRISRLDDLRLGLSYEPRQYACVTCK